MNSLTNGINTVSGTIGKIAVTSGKSPIIDISSSYLGQSTITTLGTVTTGTWNSTTIARANGGTGLTSSGALGSVLTSNGTTWIASTTAPITITGTLTSLQIKALRATPITVIPAQGVGMVIRLISVSAKLNYGTSIFTAAAAQTIIITYTSSPTVQCTLMLNAQIISSSSQFAFPVILANSGANLIVDNRGIRLINSVATEITGNAGDDSTITYSITYQLLQI